MRVLRWANHHDLAAGVDDLAHRRGEHAPFGNAGLGLQQLGQAVAGQTGAGPTRHGHDVTRLYEPGAVSVSVVCAVPLNPRKSFDPWAKYHQKKNV